MLLLLVVVGSGCCLLARTITHSHVLPPMLAIFSYGAMPYGGLKTQEVQRRVREGLRLEKPNACPNEFYDLMSSCWAADRQRRPSFENLVSEISTHLRSNTSGSSLRDIGALLKSTKQH
eukprot:m.136860 g.136860  ORF g.136860 m.136860 type:complete len:119 (+) comp9911_c0_seq2:2158-2514(+)